MKRVGTTMHNGARPATMIVTQDLKENSGGDTLPTAAILSPDRKTDIADRALNTDTVTGVAPLVARLRFMAVIDNRSPVWNMKHVTPAVSNDARLATSTITGAQE